MIEYNFLQGSSEWLAHRRNFFNASDAPAMLGVSKYKSRTELLHEYHTGLTKDVDSQTQKLFDDGHRFELLARPLAEEIIGEELYPVVGSDDKYGASFDGLNLTQSVNWENKSLNNEIRACESADDLDEMYLVQMEQQHLVSGCDKTLFTGTKFDNEGNLVDKKVFWYISDASRRQRIIEGWAQFAIDLKDYVPVEVIEKPKAATILALPSLAIQIRGEVTLSNLPEFKQAATAYIASIKTEFVTDEDFSNGEAAAKFCKDAEENIELTKNAAIAQTSSIDELMRTLDFIKGQLRDKRLIIEKLVTSEKENRKLAIVNLAKESIVNHVLALAAEIQPITMFVNADFVGVIKGKKTLTSMKDAVDTELARCKIEADKIALDIRSKLAWFNLTANDYKFLFVDLQQVIYKPNDDFQLLVNSRIKAHQETESAKEAAIKERAEAEARAKVEAEKPQATLAVAPKRPSAHQIIEMLAMHYGVHESTVIGWLGEMDLKAAINRMATA